MKTSRTFSSQENNITTQTRPAKLQILEPCNYASNMAYYRAAVVVCKHRHKYQMGVDSAKALGKISLCQKKSAESKHYISAESLSNLAMGSSFFHGSRTELGRIIDVIPIQLFAFILYQANVEKLNVQGDPVLWDLSENNRCDFMRIRIQIGF